jgi:hypothetical protein
VNEQEVEDEATENEDHAVEVLPCRLADDWGHDQKHRHQDHQDGDDQGHLR